MIKELKRYLFEKHIFVNEGQPSLETYGEIAFTMAARFGISIIDGIELASLDMVSFTAEELGEDVPEAFYRGFPASVMKLVKSDKQLLLLDQAIHYFITYGLGKFDEAGHSLIEEVLERTAFSENYNIRPFKIVTEEDAVEIIKESVESLLKSTRPLSDDQRELVTLFVSEYDYDVTFCECKDTAFALLLSSNDLKYADLFTLSDVIALTEKIAYELYDKGDIRHLHLKNVHRRLITNVIDRKFTQGRANVKECFEKRALWKGLLHHIHYAPKCDAAQEFLTSIRTGVNRSVYSAFEAAMSAGDIKGATDILLREKGSAAMLRNLNYLLSRCKDADDIAYVMDKISTKNPIVVIQMLLQYRHYKSNEERVFKFTKNNKLITHTETYEEMANRQSVITVGIRNSVVKALEKQLAEIYHGKLGKVYVEDGMENYAIPLNQSAQMDGYGVFPTGTRLPLPEGKKIRAFTYWEAVDDIDLSVIGFDDDHNEQEFSWRTMYEKQSDAICYSGDQTSGFNGGSEYFDIDIDKFKKKYPHIRYLALCNNVFSGIDFSECVCKAGYMMRDIEDSGKVFEPKTVESSYTIDCESTYAYLYAIDLDRRALVWLNIAVESDAIIAAETKIDAEDYLDIVDVINISSLFKMLATECVSDPSEADVIVGNGEYELTEGQRQITRYDMDTIVALLNNK